MAKPKKVAFMTFDTKNNNYLVQIFTGPKEQREYNFKREKEGLAFIEKEKVDQYINMGYC